MTKLRLGRLNHLQKGCPACGAKTTYDGDFIIGIEYNGYFSPDSGIDHINLDQKSASRSFHDALDAGNIIETRHLWCNKCGKDIVSLIPKGKARKVKKSLTPEQKAWKEDWDKRHANEIEKP